MLLPYGDFYPDVQKLQISKGVNRYILTSDSLMEAFQTDTHSALQAFKVDILHMCAEVWDKVKPVLCYDAPEGHVLQEVDFLDYPLFGDQATLSYCWRALMETR